eukprot:6574110-Prymnesium_polylepis.1
MGWQVRARAVAGGCRHVHRLLWTVGGSRQLRADAAGGARRVRRQRHERVGRLRWLHLPDEIDD